MKIKKKSRKFKVGKNNIIIKEVAKILLGNNEQVTFVNKKTEYDVVRKNWGYYATPSINKRLKSKGFKTALVINEDKRIYIMLVEKGKIRVFNKYCKDENQRRLLWLDENKKNKILLNL